MKGRPTQEELEDVHRRYPVEEEDVRAMLARIAPAWTMLERTEEGGIFRRASLQVFVSLARYDDGHLWIHVSACGRTGATSYYLPDWDEMKRVKHDFCGENTWAYSVLPSAKEYVNTNPYVLHLFARLDGSPALPDFTRGLGAL